MTAIYIIIGILAFTGIIIALYCRMRIVRYNRFQRDMKPEDPCRVYYGEEKHYGTLKSGIYKGEDQGLGQIWVTVSFDETQDYPHDENDHKILAKNYLRQDIYPA